MSQWVVLLLVVLLVVYDFMTHKSPPWATWPLIVAGVITHYPGTLSVWAFSIILAWLGSKGGMGGGDTRLWLAVLWAVPRGYMDTAAMVAAVVLTLTSLIQVIWRRSVKKPLTHVHPAAWKVVPFVVWALLHVKG